MNIFAKNELGDLKQLNTYMPFHKSRQDTILIASWSTLPWNTHGIWSHTFNPLCWELFNDFNIFWKRWYKPVNIKDLSKVAAPNTTSRINEQDASNLNLKKSNMTANCNKNLESFQNDFWSSLGTMRVAFKIWAATTASVICGHGGYDILIVRI